MTNNIDYKHDVFRAIVILVFSMFIMTKIIVPNITHVIGVSTAAIIVYFLYRKETTEISTLNEELVVKLRSLIPRPQYFHIDADFINLFYDIKEYRNYNMQEYDQALSDADNFLQLVGDIEIGVKDCTENLDVAEDFMFKSLNHLHAVVYKLPLDKNVWNKYQKSLESLHLLFKRKTDYIHKICEKDLKNKGFTNRTQIRYNDDNAPRPNDTKEPDYNSHYNLY